MLSLLSLPATPAHGFASRAPCNEANSSLRLTAPANSWHGVCLRISLALVRTGSCTAPSNPGPVSVSSTSGEIFSDASCRTPASTAPFPPTGGSTFYLRLPPQTPAAAGLAASYPGIGPGSLQLSPTRPQAGAVLGQPGFTSSIPNNGGLSGLVLKGPYSVARAGQKLIVADTENHRVLIWNSVPAGQSAPSVVLGQASFTTNTANSGGLSARSLDTPSFVYSDGTRLLVADTGNHRVLIWNRIPTQSNRAADLVVGQASFTTNAQNAGGVSASTLSGPNCALVSGSKLIVCDTLNNRVLIWNTIPRNNGTAAEVVVGQATMAGSSPATEPGRLNGPYFARVLGTRLAVSDYNNHRVLFWNTLPTQNGVAADTALGQPDLNSGTPMNGGLGPHSLYAPGDLALDATGRLYVSDYGNSRILLWNSVPSASGTPADSLLGQAGFHHNYANEQGGPSATGLNRPWGLYATGTELWAADYFNHRVLRFTPP